MAILVRVLEHSMGAVKSMVMDILDALTESGMDYELVAERFGVSPSVVYEIAKEYGDVE